VTGLLMLYKYVLIIWVNDNELLNFAPHFNKYILSNLLIVKDFI
jgi:hypothetical protein